MKRIVLLFLLIFPSAVLAQETPYLLLKHSAEEVATNPAVIEARKQLGAAVAADTKARVERSQLDNQIRAANEKYMQESRTPTIRTPQEYQQFLQGYQQRFNNLNERLRATNSAVASEQDGVKLAREQLRLATLEAQVDDPTILVAIVENQIWKERKDSPDLEPRIILRDRIDMRYQLTLPQPLDNLNTVNCVFTPMWGNVWAVRGAEKLPVEGMHDLPLKVASLRQVFLLERVVSAGCPFGEVRIPIPAKK